MYYVYPNLNAYQESTGILVIWSALLGLVLLAWAWDWMSRAGRGKGHAVRPPVSPG
jgi:hypothetical protein